MWVILQTGDNMYYQFWKSTSDNNMVIEIVHGDVPYGERGENAYVTEWHDSYETEIGRRNLLNRVHEWETVSFSNWDIREMYSCGCIEVSKLSLTETDKSVLSQCIEEKGFDHAMLHLLHCDYKVESNEFHGLQNDIINAKRRLETWLALNGVNIYK